MYFLFFKLHSWGKRFGSSRRRFIQRFPRVLTRKLLIRLSLRGPKGRGNLLVPPIEMYSSIETLYREIATSLRSSQ